MDPSTQLTFELSYEKFNQTAGTYNELVKLNEIRYV